MDNGYGKIKQHVLFAELDSIAMSNLSRRTGYQLRVSDTLNFVPSKKCV